MTLLTSLKLPGLEPIPKPDILYLQGAGNYAIIHLISRKQHLIACTLRTMEERTGFLRIHKSYLVNPEHILGLERGATKFTNLLRLRDGQQLAVSKREYKNVLMFVRNLEEPISLGS